MYTPSQFDESRKAVLHALIRMHPLATVVFGTPAGIDAEHLPLILVESRGRCGALQGHVARANPIWRNVAADAEVLAIFHGADRYVSPKWYPSKRLHGRVVPTWNYLVAHARGSIRWYHDPGWLRDHLEAATRIHEGPQEPWTLGDAPPGFIDRMLGAIVGFEILVDELRGKWKLSQNRIEDDRRGVMDGLRAQADSRAAEMLEWMSALDRGA